MKVWRNKMTIGQQLKKFRLLLGLSQADMAAGIVTASFYSKVERDQSEIVIDKLVEILNIYLFMTFLRLLIKKICQI